ncbi:arabinan endo-1,5-alpha-L-arabinosidase [Tessaracoccus sp. OS52]|uniref:arabinan endo-1,5-alpha-L-arabinosidase n=1 Tax=Tessaracoccus sp. OS52 TaxID=2886691 RepID=UPI001D10571C|nr:arabinan endo-1,5-alpha-L-arabinosidase [Tessaracoccus sp. OS52]MCC2592441.1 arabinan endo-1,5-alpha-L-arabinosidase [Tessaracoccus sp. OS52]
MEPDYLAAATSGSGGDPAAWGAHDPTIVRARDGRWLMFSTDTAVAGGPGAGAQIRQSDDLVHWRWFGHAFDGVPSDAAQWSNAIGIWAPEVIRRGDEYRMYYSVSSFGSRTSAIGLATAPDATGPWQHRELVVSTHHETSEVNAIDAAVVVDSDGSDWLLYGSFFGGLRILPLGADGRPLVTDDVGTSVVRRARSINGAVEGGHAIYDEESGTYALLCSFDSLFDTYNVRVARATSVTGPYVDPLDRPMIDTSEPPTQVGAVILAGYEAPDGTTWIAPGHSSHLVTDSGVFLVHHVRDGSDPTRHTAHVRRLEWTRTGWPLASPLPWGGPVASVPGDLGGEWLFYSLDAEAKSPHRPRRVDLAAETFTALAESGRAKVTVEGRDFEAVLFVEADGVAVAGMDERGVVGWLVKA